MQRLKVELSKIRLWLENPRVDAATNQEAEIKAIYESGSSGGTAAKREENSHRQLLNLAQSISDKGFQTEVDPLIAVEHKGLYTIRDGNRRFSALLLLKEPDKYKFLKSNDLKALKTMRQESLKPIPDEIELVVFSENDEDKMKEVISRKHTGPLDGVGVVQWSSEAKQRFTNKQKFSDKLESPFEKQFGETLSSYLGGSYAVTTTQRIYGYKATKDYLNIKEGEITEEVLDRAKNLADELKTKVSETRTPLSRLNANDVKEVIETIKKNEGKERIKNTTAVDENADSKILDFESFKKSMKKSNKQNPKRLGMEFICDNSFIPELKEFYLVNRLIQALWTFGELVGDLNKRELKMLILCPVIRVLFEQSLKGIKDSIPNTPKSFESLRKNLNQNVQVITDMFKQDNNFYNYLNKAGLYEGYTQAKTLIEARRFAKSADESNLASHSADQMLDANHIESLFNDSVLFASLCQHYVLYSRKKQSQTQL